MFTNKMDFSSYVIWIDFTNLVTYDVASSLGMHHHVPKKWHQNFFTVLLIEWLEDSKALTKGYDSL